MTEAPSRKLAAVLHADVVGSTTLVQLDESLAHQRMQRVFRRFAEIIARHGGIAHEIRGDALVAEFARVSDAIAASTEFQQANTAFNAELADEVRPVVRVGIALGEVVIADSTITGAGVILAQRLEQLAAPGGICLQGAAYETVPKHLPFAYHNLGDQILKGFAEPVRAYAVVQPDQDSAPTRQQAAAPGRPDQPSIAVLPLTNMSGDPEQEYFADGITEDIITELSRLSNLLVISRNSTFTYKGRTVKAQEIARDLGVRYVLEGSVRKAGSRVRITAQLIDGLSGGHLWAERYDRGLDDIFAVQDDVTAKIVRALEASLGINVDDQPPRVQPANAEAYDYLLRGREQYRLFTPEGNRVARQLYQQAIALDPDYAAAYAGLAETYMHDWFRGAPQALEQAFQLAVKADELDASLPIVQEALSSILLFSKQHDQAVASARRWLQIEPGSADAYANLASILQFTGQPEQVLQLIEKAISLNPYYPFYYLLYVGHAHLVMEDYPAAREALQRTLTRNPESLNAHVCLAACLGLMGAEEHARQEFAEIQRIYPGISSDWVRTYIPYQHQADTDRLITGLRKAGLSA